MVNIIWHNSRCTDVGEKNKCEIELKYLKEINEPLQVITVVGTWDNSRPSALET